MTSATARVDPPTDPVQILKRVESLIAQAKDLAGLADAVLETTIASRALTIEEAHRVEALQAQIKNIQDA